MFEFLLAFFLFYMWHMLGTTIGYHRLLSHRSFTCKKFVEYFWVAGGYLAFEGSPMWWASIHRAHHRYADTELDPHSPRYGVKRAFHGWIRSSGYPPHINPGEQSRDLMSDPVYRFLDQGGQWRRAHSLTRVIGVVFRLIILVLFGWKVALASLIAGFTVLQIPLLLNVVCHIPRLGYKNYATRDDSVNVWWVALLTAGEGWHNNHHAFPGSARAGIRKFEVDLSWLTLRLLKACKLVSGMHEPTVSDEKRIHTSP